MLCKSFLSSGRSSYLTDCSSRLSSSSFSSSHFAGTSAAVATTESVGEETEETSNTRRNWKNLSPLHMRKRNQCSLLILLLTLLEIGVVPHNQIGFFCNDEKISRKFTGDTISVTLLLACSLIAPFIVMWLVEYICHSSDTYNTDTGSSGSRLKQTWFWYGHYSVGLVSLVFVIAIMKVLIGEPRPHFLETCRPREAFNCTNEYIEAYTCTNTVDSTWFVSDSSKSFPSGHSAISMYTTIFLVCYLQNRLTRKTLLIKPWLQCTVSLWAMVCSLTRITDNRHHWWDVLVGDALGVVFSVLVIAIPCRNFRVGGEKYLVVRVPKDSIGSEQKNIKKLLNSGGEMDITEGRELRDVTASWKE